MILKEKIAFLEAENKKLIAANFQLAETNFQLTETNFQLKKTNFQLEKKVEEQGTIIRWFSEQHRLAVLKKYGQSSEKTALHSQLGLFNEAEEIFESGNEAEAKTVVASCKRKKAKGKREGLFKDLPKEQVIHELPESQRVCPCCEGQMHPCGQEVLRKEVEVIPVQVKVIEHVQVVYACRSCEKSAADKPVPMVKSLVPAPVVRGSGIASPSLVALIACNKYLLALPLNRQEKEFERLGLDISRQTMANWLMRVAGKWLAPIYQLLHRELLASPINHADETTLQVMNEEGREASQKSWMWLYCTGRDAARQVFLYEYQPGRGREHPLSFLHGFSGFLHADAYAAYRCLEAQGVTIVGCWAHARRKFDEALKVLKKEDRQNSPAKIGLDFCNKLFQLERDYDDKNLSLDQRQSQRLQESKKVADDFFDWCEKAQCKAAPKMALSKAITYALNQKSYLMGFLLDPRIELSNNRAERAIRPFTVGRKNWLFSFSAKGAEASAILYSIIETALANGLIPFNYLRYLFESLPNHSSNDLTEFLPWHPKVQRLCKIQAPS